MRAAPRKRLCVFCGSRPGSEAAYIDAARNLGEALAAREIGLVFGGASIGVMGELADAALAGGGEVIGVIPTSLLDREVAHESLTDLRIVGSMHERKALMADLSSGFVTLPGGIGTLEELFEVWTWAHLGIHDKPMGLLNVAGFFDPLLAFVDRLVEDGFLAAKSRRLIIDTDAIDRLLDQIMELTDRTQMQGSSGLAR